MLKLQTPSFAYANNTQPQLAKSLQKLSSGLRINSAADDAAGLAIANRLSDKNKSLSMAVRNANDAISVVQTGEGALGSTMDSLQRMRELAVQSANGTLTANDRTSLDAEFGQLANEVQRVFTQTTFNGKAINGADAGDQVFQVGPGAEDTVTVTTQNMAAHSDITKVVGTDASGTGRASIAGNSPADINKVIQNIDTAIQTVSTERATFGASQSRFDAAIHNLSTSIENQTAARSRITDADFASETANMSRLSVLQQAGLSVLSQANQAPQIIGRFFNAVA